jgi:hypothetical protein
VRRERKAAKPHEQCDERKVEPATLKHETSLSWGQILIHAAKITI